MLLEMIQRHFPSLPLDDRYTDWQKWLGFARAAYEAGTTTEREACASLIAGDELWMIASKEERRELAEAIRERSNALGQEPCAGVCARSPAPEGYTSGTTEKE